jgi:hypothetical protein
MTGNLAQASSGIWLRDKGNNASTTFWKIFLAPQYIGGILAGTPY